MAEVKQDMPPPGGFAAINYKQLTGKPVLGYKTIFGTITLLGAVGWTVYAFTRWRRRLLDIEHNSVRFALTPFIMAEQDRMHLKHIRKIRKMESEVMKDHPLWETGTLFGAPVYFTLKEGEWYYPDINEMLAFCGEHYKDKTMRTMFSI